MKKVKFLFLFLSTSILAFSQPDSQNGVVEIGADYPCFAQFNSDKVTKVAELKETVKQITLPAGKYSLSLGGKQTGPFFLVTEFDIPSNTIMNIGKLEQARFRFEAEFSVTLQDVDGIPYSNESVKLYKPHGEIVATGSSDKNGKFKVILPRDKFPLLLKCSFFDTILTSDKQMSLDPNSSGIQLTWQVKSPQNFNLLNVYFETASDKLKPPFDELNKAAGFILRKGLKFEIGGHTDDVGDDAYNQQLSEKRAKSVKNYLVTHGANTSLLQVKGYGKSQPVATNTTEAGKAKNRRVSIITIQ